MIRKYYDAAATETKGGATDLILKKLGEIDDKQTKGLEGVKTELTKQIADTKGELTEEIGKAKGTSQKALEKVEDLEKKAATNGFGGSPAGPKSLYKSLSEQITAHKSELPLSVGKKFSFEIDNFNSMETKVVGNMGSAANLTGSYFVQPTVVPGVIMQPYNQVHMRDILPLGNTGQTNTIRYVRDNGGEGGPAMVAEAGTKPQVDRDLAIIDSPIRKIATYFRVPEEMIEDIPFLTSFLSNVGTEEVLAVEDTQILYGDGTGQNLSGLATAGNFTAFAAGTSVLGGSPNEFDVLRAADKQMRTLKRTPSISLVSPTDYFNMISRKDSTGNYILSGGGNGLVPTVNGFPIVQMNQIAAGDFIVMDRSAAQIFFRANITVRFYEQDQDNAIKNLVTIVIEERLALAIYYVSGIIKGTFAAGITDLTT
jgi:HK97 family phage major capsid protein